MIQENEIDLSRVPQHVAIIMDGNGRWAKVVRTVATSIIV